MIPWILRRTHRTTDSVLFRWGASLGALVILFLTSTAAANRFFDDDPLAREPETQDASKAAPRDIDLFWDLASNLFGRPGDPAVNVKAKNVNTIDEVPDSNWFTNRIGARPLTTDEIARGPLMGEPPAQGKWTITRAKDAGAAPGFTARDARGELWFVSFDANGYPEAATGAILVANKIFWALGYWQVENFLVTIRPEEVSIGEGARITPPSGRRRPMNGDDLADVFARSHRSVDGAFRGIAARGLPGKILGGFSYYGTRPDDPNDIVPHEHRRELRALKVFGAWTNLVDMKAGNTLDTVIEDRGRQVVRHYLQDVGSTFGTGANAPREWEEGWEYLYEGGTLWKRLVSLGFYSQPWQSARYESYPAIGRFEGDAFDPEAWKPRVPTAAFLRARADDDFWAARRVAAFSDEALRAAVRTGAFSDAAAEKHLADVLIQRRDRIAKTYLPALNPIVNPVLDASGTLTFANAAVDAGVANAPGGGYAAEWFRFDNATQETSPLGRSQSQATRIQPPPSLPQAAGTFLKVQISALGAENAAWATPVDAYFRRVGDAWRLVGLDRMP
ncbi:MAG: hypothetical protein AB7I50_06125 [Vicinamibacterales bacterium]